MTEESISTTLKEIYARVPKEWRENAVITTSLTPTMEKIVNDALTDRGFPKEKKEALQALKDNGYFSKQKYTENTSVIKKIDSFVNRQINKAIKEGRLPNKAKLAELKELWKKQKETSSTN